MFCTSITGCGLPRGSVKQLSNSYQEVTYTRTSISEPPAHRISLQYRNSKGQRVLVWPSTRNTVVKGDLAVFVGNGGYDQPRLDEPRATQPRLFAVKMPGLPLDISDEVLWRWSQQSGGDFTEVLKKANIMFPKEKGDALEFQFAIYSPPNWPVIAIQLDWNQISDIMREVKEKGVVRKDRVWGTSYIEKEFKPEVQK